MSRLQQARVIDTLARMLFPRLHGRARRRKLRALGLGLLLGSLVGCLVGLLLWHMNRPVIGNPNVPDRYKVYGPLGNGK